MLSGPSILATAGRLLRGAEALLLPAACLGCERALPPHETAQVVCGRCRLLLRPVARPWCERCGQPRDRWDPAPGVCGFCRPWPAELGWARSAARHDDDTARALVHGLKYDGWTVAAQPMAEAMVRQFRGDLCRYDALVPVPLGRLRRRARGHNQAEVLARAIAERAGVPVARDLLVRRRETRSQTALAPDARRANVAGAFAGTAAARGQRLLVVDDVLTTGATLAACAAALHAAGAAQIGALTFARAAVPM